MTIAWLVVLVLFELNGYTVTNLAWWLLVPFLTGDLSFLWLNTTVKQYVSKCEQQDADN